MFINLIFHSICLFILRCLFRKLYAFVNPEMFGEYTYTFYILSSQFTSLWNLISSIQKNHYQGTNNGVPRDLCHIWLCHCHFRFTISIAACDSPNSVKHSAGGRCVVWDFSWQSSREASLESLLSDCGCQRQPTTSASSLASLPLPRMAMNLMPIADGEEPPKMYIRFFVALSPVACLTAVTKPCHAHFRLEWHVNWSAYLIN